MKHWMHERDQLIEQTLAFVEGIAAARPARTAAAAVARAEPIKPAARPAVADPGAGVCRGRCARRPDPARRRAGS